MPTYRDWELYEVLPSGWKIDKHCGSPLFGYDFCTDGKSIINGGKRALVKTETNKAIMKEFHSDNLHLFNCDNIELMKTFKDKEFDLAIVDPPYGINAPKMSATPCQRASGSKRLNGGGGKLKGRKLNTSNIDWDSCIPTGLYFDELMRISENQIIWGGNYFNLPPSRCIICWDKVQPWENFSQVELAWTSFDSPAQLYRFDNRTGGKIHPTEKPIELYEYLLRKYAKPNFKILDTHFGSGSHGIAIEKANQLDKMNLSLTAIELDEEYFDKSVERIKVFKMQKTLF